MTEIKPHAEWVSATAARNHVQGNPLLDWLDQHGESKGFERDQPDERTDFGLFIMRKGREFEDAVVRHLSSLAIGEIVTIAGASAGEQVDATIQAMSDGTALICQGRLNDPQTRTFGLPDLLVRSDVLPRLFPEAPATEAESRFGAWHYVVVDIKYSTLHLNAAGGLGNNDSAPAYKAQVYIYNRALAAAQDYLPPHAFVLGRGWRQTIKRKTMRGNNCVERLGAVPYDGTIANKMPISDAVDAAVDWVRRVRAEGAGWDALPEPSVPELRPLADGEHGVWSTAVKQIIAATEDLTSLYYVSPKGRDVAGEHGITRWSDPIATPETLGVKGVHAGRLQAILDVNRGDGPPVTPETVQASREEWAESSPLEFYVDFETVSDLDDRFDAIPDKNGQALIFMVGCGHLDGGEWKFECFVADDLTERSEAATINGWLNHMNTVAATRGLAGQTPRAVHWEHIERTALAAAAERNPHAEGSWHNVEWFDFLTRVMRAEPVAVRGAQAFGLKAVANAMCDLGLTDTRWGSGPTDGLGAMVGAWWCQREVESGAVDRLVDLPLMREIREYNEVDCKAMMEIVRYLRRNH